MRTIQEWFNLFPEPYKTQALNNYHTQSRNRNTPYSKPWDAVDHGFSWSITPEKDNYWYDFYLGLESGRIKLNIPNSGKNIGFGTYDRRFIEFSRK